MSVLPKFYNAWFCPFAQRAWIALLEKGVEFEYVEIDPYNKTPEWLAVNPRGLVPAIVHEGRSVYESAVCIEYVDEAWHTGKHLLPSDPYQRARTRIWSDHVTSKIQSPFYRLLMKREEGERGEAKADLLGALQQLVAEMDPEGPFFGGKTLGMVDIMLAPYSCRFGTVLKHYRGFEVPREPETTWQRYHTWWSAVEQHPSVKETLPDVDKLLASYQRYADDTAQSEVAKAVRKGVSRF